MRQALSHRRLRNSLTIAGLFTLAACQTVGKAPPSTAALADTQWVLIEYSAVPGKGQAQEVTLNRYTMTLAKDGSMQAKLDCNRGLGTWTAIETKTGSGTISFGPVAATRAMCPEDSIGERLAADLPSMVTWSVYDGRLTLKPANGGPQYVWDTID